LLIVGAALAIGLPLGVFFGREVTGMYAELFHFPEFSYRVHFGVLAAGAAVSAAAGVAGCVGAVARAARLPPAEAMRAEPPSGFGPTLLERLGLGRFVPPILLMITRHLERHPVKSGLSILAIALAASVLVVGNFFEDAVDYMMDAQFNRVQRFDMAVATVEPVHDRAVYELASLPGVLRAEAVRAAPVRLRAGPRSRLTSIQGIDADAELFGLVAMDGRAASLPEAGLLVSAKLAETLDVRPGDWVEAEFLDGKRPVVRMMIAATLEDFAGLSAYLRRDALHRALREGPVVTSVNLLVDPARADGVSRRLRELPRAAGVAVKAYALESFQRTIAENMRLMKSINLMFACAIAVGVVYNNARLAVAERGRELATLRVLGFTRGEISAIFLGELAVVTLLAVPLGLLLGRGMAWYLIQSFDQELFRFPLIISRNTYAFAALVVLSASLASGLAVRTRLDRLDLAEALKSRE
jgi:putative ABC transport system permease protein